MTGEVRPGAGLPRYEVPAVSAEKMKTMSALMRDANPIHYDPAAVRALGLGDRVINQGPLNQAYIVTMLGTWAGGADRVRALRLRFLGNVFAGDRPVAGGTVTDVRQAEHGTVADCDVWLDVAGRGTVLRGTATVLIGEAGGG